MQPSTNDTNNITTWNCCNSHQGSMALPKFDVKMDIEKWMKIERPILWILMDSLSLPCCNYDCTQGYHFIEYMCVPGFSGKYKRKKIWSRNLLDLYLKSGFCWKRLPKQTTQTMYLNGLKIQATHTVYPRPNRLKTQATQTDYPNKLPKQITQTD